MYEVRINNALTDLSYSRLSRVFLAKPFLFSSFYACARFLSRRPVYSNCSVRFEPSGLFGLSGFLYQSSKTAMFTPRPAIRAPMARARVNGKVGRTFREKTARNNASVKIDHEPDTCCLLFRLCLPITTPARDIRVCNCNDKLEIFTVMQIASTASSIMATLTFYR